jgi:hypothetical protein
MHPNLLTIRIGAPRNQHRRRYRWSKQRQTPG